MRASNNPLHFNRPQKLYRTHAVYNVMFTCPKCGKKLKTLHERVYGEKPHYQPAGYHCKTCRIYYDTEKHASKAVYGVARKNELGGLPAENSEIERMRSLHKPHSILSKNECENSNTPTIVSEPLVHEVSGWGEIRTLDHLCVRQVS